MISAWPIMGTLLLYWGVFCTEVNCLNYWFHKELKIRDALCQNQQNGMCAAKIQISLGIPPV